MNRRFVGGADVQVDMCSGSNSEHRDCISDGDDSPIKLELSDYGREGAAGPICFVPSRAFGPRGSVLGIP